jgi:hypothetical protein
MQGTSIVSGVFTAVLAKLSNPKFGLTGRIAGNDRFFCGGGKSGKIRAVRWPRRSGTKGQRL